LLLHRLRGRLACGLQFIKSSVKPKYPFLDCFFLFILCFWLNSFFPHKERQTIDLQREKEKAFREEHEVNEWYQTTLELYAERAVWGDSQPSASSKWKLDQVEG